MPGQPEHHGGDPLPEAPTAGETPTPAMVAASDRMGLLPVWAVVTCLATVFVGLVGIVVWGDRTNTINVGPHAESPDALVRKAREIAVSFGYTEDPVDNFYDFLNQNRAGNWAAENLEPETLHEIVASGDLPQWLFQYVQSPAYLTPTALLAPSSLTDPGRMAGMISMSLDPQGRLAAWTAGPLRENAPAPGPDPDMDWTTLFEAAGLDQGRWTRVEPEVAPDPAFDERAAWTGTYPGAPGIPLRIEAAALAGRLVWFEVRGPWLDAPPGSRDPRGFLMALMVVAATLVAIRNWRSRRGDRQGAARLCAFVWVCVAAGSLLTRHHTPTAWELAVWIQSLLGGLLAATAVGILYFALEPYVRRHWPQALISWTRLLRGDAKNPVVAGHILIGMAGAMVATFLFGLALSYGGRPLPLRTSGLEPLRLIGEGWLVGVALAVAVPLAITFLLVLARAVFRRTWLTGIAVVLFVSMVGNLLIYEFPAGLFGVPAYALFIFMALRFGPLPLAFFVLFQVPRHPFTLDMSAWYADTTVMEVALIVTVSLWAFHYAMGGRKMWQPAMLNS